jgi:hypothetical protein
MCPDVEDDENDHVDKMAEAEVARFRVYMSSESEDDS